MNPVKLYGYWRSSASWRVRWAFELLGTPFEYIPVNLLKGEHKSDEYLKLNPMGMVPFLKIDSSKGMSQSLAMINWAENCANTTDYYLMPEDVYMQTKCIELCEIIGAETAPLQTPRIQKLAKDSEEDRKNWTHLHIRNGLSGYEKICQPFAEEFSLGAELSLADIFLIPQIYNARRYGVDMETEFPLLNKIYNNCFKLESCIKSSPEKQKDAQ